MPQNAVYDLHAAIPIRTPFWDTFLLIKATAMKMMDITRQGVPDLPIRIIAASASFYSVPLLTRDERLRGLSLETIW